MDQTLAGSTAAFNGGIYMAKENGCRGSHFYWADLNVEPLIDVELLLMHGGITLDDDGFAGELFHLA